MTLEDATIIIATRLRQLYKPGHVYPGSPIEEHVLHELDAAVNASRIAHALDAIGLLSLVTKQDPIV